MKRKILVSLLSLSMLLAMTPAMAFAQEADVCLIGGKPYGSLKAAFDAVAQQGSASATIKMVSDATTTSTLEVLGKSVTIDLNGYSITGSGCRAFQVKFGSLDFTGIGSVTSTGISTSSSVIRVGCDDLGSVQGTQAAGLTVGEAVTVTSDCSYGITAFGLKTEESVTVNGTVVSNADKNSEYDGCAISTNGREGEEVTAAQIFINEGAEVTAANSNGIYMPSGKLTVNGGTVKGTTGIYVKGGSTTIKGGTIEGTGAVKAYEYYLNGGKSTGDALVVDNCSYPSAPPTVTVEGGTFKSENAKAVGSYASQGENTPVTGFVYGGSYDDLSALDYCAVTQDGVTVSLCKDVTLRSTYNYNNPAYVTLDMNGNNISAYNCRALWIKAGGLSIVNTAPVVEGKDNGGVISANKKNDEAGASNFAATSSVIRVGNNESSVPAAKKAVSLTIAENVSVDTQHCYGVTVFGNATTETLNVYGAIYARGEASAISGNGTNGYGGTTINIFDTAIVKADNDVAIYHPQSGTLNITGGYIEGKGGVEAKGGKIASGATDISVIGNPTIVAKGKTEHVKNCDGTSTKGYAIAAVNNSMYAGKVSVTIDGGKYTGPIAVFDDDQVAEEKQSEIVIKDGLFSIKPEAEYIAKSYSAISNTADETKADYPYTIGCVVKFFVDGKKVDESETTIGGYVARPVENPEKTDYIFAGWADSEGATFNFASDNVLENMSLNAMWLKSSDASKVEVKENNDGIKAATSLNVADVPLSQSDIEKIKEGKTLKVDMNIEKITDVPEEDKDLISYELNENQKVGMYLNISIKKYFEGDAEATEVEETNNLVGITLTIPENLRAKDRVYSIVRVHGEDVETIWSGKANDNWQITFTSDKFSTYALVYEGGTSIDTGDSNDVFPVAIMLILSVLALGGYAGVSIRRKRG